MEKLRADVEGCLETLAANNDSEKCAAGLEILHKLMKNILNDPTNQKFRTIKRSNKAI